MGEAMLSKSLIQFSVEGWGCVPSLLFDLSPNYGGGNEDNGDLLQKVPSCTATLTAPKPAADHISSELSTMVCLSWVARHCMLLSLTELDKAVVHVIRLVNFL